MSLHLNSYLRAKLINSVLASMNELGFRDFTLNDSFRLQYEKSIALNTGFDIGVGQYIDKLVRIGTVSNFIDALLIERSDNDKVTDFYKELQQTHENLNDHWQIKKEIFDRSLVQKQILPFIGRTHFSDTLTKMLNGEIHEIIILRGPPGSGASYINYYLLEIEEKHECFKYHYINIDKIRKSYCGEMISAAHIAEMIASELGMDFNRKEFKLQPFKSSLKLRLENIAREQNICLFFFDQFNEPMSKEKKLISDDIQLLIDEFVDLIVQNGRSYFVLSGYENYNKNWPMPVQVLPAKVDIKSFTAAQVDNFLEKLYGDSGIDFQSKINRPTFFATAKGILPEHIFDPSDEPNVKIIGEKLTKWLIELREDLNI